MISLHLSVVDHRFSPLQSEPPQGVLPWLYSPVQFNGGPAAAGPYRGGPAGLTILGLYYHTTVSKTPKKKSPIRQHNRHEHFSQSEIVVCLCRWCKFLSLLSINQSILERLSCRSHCGNLCTLYIRSISSSPHLSHFIHNTKPLHSALFFPNDVQEFLESFSLSLCVHWKLIPAPYVHCYIMHMATALVFMNISFLLFFLLHQNLLLYLS